MRQIPTEDSVNRYASETDGVVRTAEGQMIFKSIISVREASWATTLPKILLRSAADAIATSIFGLNVKLVYGLAVRRLCDLWLKSKILRIVGSILSARVSLRF